MYLAALIFIGVYRQILEGAEEEDPEKAVQSGAVFNGWRGEMPH